MVIFGVIFFLLGTIIGSFLNVLIYRLPRQIPFIRERSFCPGCRKKISWYDNIPLLSFIYLKGKCRNCRGKISFRYPLVELITGVFFVLGSLGFISNISNQTILSFLNVCLAWILFSGLTVIFFVDLENQIIPEEMVIFLTAVFVIYRLSLFFIKGNNLMNSILVVPLLAAIASFLFLFLIFWVTEGKGMGFGDVKLAFVMGLVLSYPRIIIAFYLAFLTGAVAGVILILLRRARFGQRISFGPFLVYATIVSYLWGEKIYGIFLRWLF